MRRAHGLAARIGSVGARAGHTRSPSRATGGSCRGRWRRRGISRPAYSSTFPGVQSGVPGVTLVEVPGVRGSASRPTACHRWSRGSCSDLKRRRPTSGSGAMTNSLIVVGEAGDAGVGAASASPVTTSTVHPDPEPVAESISPSARAATADESDAEKRRDHEHADRARRRTDSGPGRARPRLRRRQLPRPPRARSRPERLSCASPRRPPRFPRRSPNPSRAGSPDAIRSRRCPSRRRGRPHRIKRRPSIRSPG